MPQVLLQGVQGLYSECLDPGSRSRMCRVSLRRPRAGKSSVSIGHPTSRDGVVQRLKGALGPGSSFDRVLLVCALLDLSSVGFTEHAKSRVHGV